MMANQAYRTPIVFLFVFSAWFVTSADSSVRRRGPAEADGQAQAVVIVRATGYDYLRQEASGSVLSTIRGSVEKGTDIQFFYPDINDEETWTHYGPLESGTCLLVFLKEQNDSGFWLPALAREGTARLRELGISSSTEGVSRYRSRAGLWNIPCEEVPTVSSLLPQLLQWEELDNEERTEVLDKCFKSGSSAMKRMALEWIFTAPHFDFLTSGGRNGSARQLAEWGALCLSDPDREVKRLALVSLNMAATAGVGVAPYFAGVLDDPDWFIRIQAADSLERIAGHAAGAPVTDASHNLDLRVSAWKKWWEEKGSRMPEFKADIVPGGTEEEHLQPDAPGE